MFENDNNYADSFLLELDGKIALYFPLKRKICAINRSTLNHLNEGKIPKPIQSILKSKCLDVYEIGKQNNIPGSTPVGLTLMPSYDCNFRCIYCYADGGSRKINMSWKMAKSGIDFIFGNLIESKRRTFNVTFFGGGEPTFNWDVFTKSFEYSKLLCENENINLHTTISTNGCLSKRKINWISENIDSIQISFDGIEEVQNYTRPMIKGQQSYESVFKACKILDKNMDELNKKFAIRSTVIEKFVDKIPTTVKFFIENFKNVKRIAFEPVHKAGRYNENICSIPSAEDFMKYFIEGRIIGRRYDVTINFASANLDKTSISYCGSCGKAFVLTPEGMISSCPEVTNTNDELSDIYIYGKYNKEDSSFYLDHDKLNELRKININNIERCNNCFAKYNCSGGCSASAARITKDPFVPLNDFCEITRTVLKEEIFYLLKSGKDIDNESDPESISC